jgi:nucleotide-binding universal stress UspA family protein
MGQIIVGMDGSECAGVALQWALREAELREWAITTVLAWSYLDQRPTSPGEPFDPTYNEDNAREALDAAIQRAVGEEAAGAIERKVICDLPASALLSEAEGADLLVVGSRGLGGFKGLLLGSVSEQCLHHATCPVAVVRDVEPGAERPAAQPERVVVGIDGSDASQRGLRWALDEARARGAAIDAVYAWRSPIVGVGPGAVPLDSGPIEAEARSLLDAAIEAEDTSGLAHPVRRVVLSGSPAEVVLQTAKGANLVVLGSRGVGGFSALLLGSVSHQVARHAPCPVVVVK